MKNNIKLLRSQFQLTQEDIAKKTGVTRQTINAIENNKYSPTLELAMRLAQIFNTSVEEIFQLDD
ncbi:TPA: helix-turn-helix transcriptional regulator [Listeria monocytogenes]|nr:helix-turn-helix transcriptional regulator [Listeria monocytogenes]